MDEKVKDMLKYLRFPYLVENWKHILDIASNNNFSHKRLIEYIIEHEYHRKMENSRKLRISKAKIPEKFVIETFPFSKQPKLNKKKIINLYDNFDYMTQNRNIIWFGPTGVGKTGLATAFLMQAINRGYKGRFIRFPELIEMLYKSIADHSEAQIIKTFTSYQILVIDELGYIDVEPVQVDLFFTLMQNRHKKKSTLITSNLGFEQWISFLKNEHLTAALLDRLTENSHIINMRKCVSLRPRLDPIID
jgi:DNA replication protein DnaC